MILKAMRSPTKQETTEENSQIIKPIELNKTPKPNSPHQALIRAEVNQIPWEIFGCNHVSYPNNPSEQA